MRFGSKPLRIVGLAAFVVGLVGYVFFDRRFDSSADPVASGLAVGRVVVAVTVLRAR